MEHILTAMRKSGAGREIASIAETGGIVPRSARDAIWTDLPAAGLDREHLAANRIVTAGRSDPAHGAFDLMRTRMLHEMRRNGWTSVAITSPTRGAGKTVVALNLAFSLANCEDCRTVLLDLDLRCPGVADHLGVDNAPALEGFLQGRLEVEKAFRRYRPNLAIAANGQPVRLSAELLQSARAASAFRDLRRKLVPDVVICDLPPVLGNDDVVAFLPNTDATILVVEAGQNTAEEVDACERELSHHTNILGIVLNKCRFETDLTSNANGG
jgi:Mrp family chromosome partitioning ATPase